MPRSLRVGEALKQLMRLTDLVSLQQTDKNPLKGLTERELIQLESEIGRELFGPIAKGHRREFFNTDPRVWIWHEEWRDENGKMQQITVKYEIHDDAGVKVLPGPRYEKVEGTELANLRAAVGIYFERVMREVYRRDPASGRPLL